MPPCPKSIKIPSKVCCLLYACIHYQESFCLFFTNKHQNVPLVNYQQKCLINSICGILEVKSNYFGPVMPKKLKKL